MDRGIHARSRTFARKARHKPHLNCPTQPSSTAQGTQVACQFDAAADCPQTTTTSDHEAPSSSRQLTPGAPIPLSQPLNRAPEEELNFQLGGHRIQHPSPRLTDFEPSHQKQHNHNHNHNLKPPKMVSRIAFWAGFGTSSQPPICPSIQLTPDPTQQKKKKNTKLTITLRPHRRRSPLLAARHRDAALLQPRLALGVPGLRRRGR